MLLLFEQVGASRTVLVAVHRGDFRESSARKEEKKKDIGPADKWQELFSLVVDLVQRENCLYSTDKESKNGNG
jgi:hypothetical protein